MIDVLAGTAAAVLAILFVLMVRADRRRDRSWRRLVEFVNQAMEADDEA